MDGLKDKVVIITGAGSGIGEGTAYYFLKYGCKLSLVDKDSERLEEVVSTCRSKQPDCEVISIVADITKNEDRKNIIESTIRTYGCIDVLINNAGIVSASTASETDEDTMNRLFEVNTFSHFSLSKLAVPYLKDSKGCYITGGIKVLSTVIFLLHVAFDNSVLGNIVNTSSIVSQRGLSSLGVYSMTKAAVDMFTEVLAGELGPFGVRVNSVNPGTIRTSICSSFIEKEEYEKLLKDQVQYHPLGRVGEPEDVAKCVAFLASDMASFVTGHHLFVDGGRHCQHIGDIKL